MLCGCSEPGSDTEAPEAPRNVILISIDTLRADHVGTYGYEVDTTPNIDSFAERSIVFERTTSQAPGRVEYSDEL